MHPLADLRQRLSLRSGTDQAGTTERLSAGTSLSAESMWLLVCSAVLASIGLDVSSAAVIIGAMLISPLMGPILGAGLAMGIADRALLQRAIRELGIATVISLAASAGYFLLSPLGEPTPELVARIRPTLLDVGVALFGGVAGIVAASRRQQSMALPGVAIATALMPPLCTAGFGLATGNWAFFFGAFYLFLLNAIFIALATFLVVRLLHFPRHEFRDAAHRRREVRLVTVVTVLAVLPSAYFLYDAGRELRERGRIAGFIERELEGQGREVYQWEVVSADSGRVLKAYLAGTPLEAERMAAIREAMPAQGLAALRLEVIQSDISASDLARLGGEVQREVMRTVQLALAARDSAAVSAAAVGRRDSVSLAAVARELAGAFPEIIAVAYVARPDLLAPDSARLAPGLLLTFDPGTPAASRRDILQRARSLVLVRVPGDSMAILER